MAEFDLSGLSDDDRAALAARIADRRERKRAREGLVQEQGAKDTARKLQVGQGLIEWTAKTKGMAGTTLSPDAAARIGAPMSPERADAMTKRVNDIAGGIGLGGGNVSRDVEGALARGGREVVAGDQRLVVGPFGEPLATRKQNPTVWEHLKSLDQEYAPKGSASLLGAAGDMFAAPLRATATGVLDVTKKIQGDPTAPKLADIPGNMLKGAAGIDGENIATRGGGWGDVLRDQARKMGDLTARDLLGAGPTPNLDAVNDVVNLAMNAVNGVDQSYSGEATRFLDRKLKDISDDEFDAWGEALSLPLDPLNFVGGLPAKAAGKLLELGGSAARRVVPRALADGVAEIAARDFKHPLTYSKKAQLVDGGFASTPESAAKILQGKDDALLNARAGEASLRNDLHGKLIEAQAGLEKADAPIVNDLIVGSNPEVPQLKDRGWAQQYGMFREAADDPARMARLTTEQQDIVKRAIAPVGPDTGTGAVDGLRLRRHEIASKLGIDMFEPHPWQNGTAAQRRQISGARAVANDIDRSIGEKYQQAGRLNPAASLEGYSPRAPRTAISVQAEKLGLPRPLRSLVEGISAPFIETPRMNPLAHRTMTDNALRDEIRVAAWKASEIGTFKAQPDLHRAMRKFASSAELQANPAARALVAKELVGVGALPEDVLEKAASRKAADKISVDTANTMLDDAGRPMQFEKDPIKARAIAADAAAAQLGKASYAKGLRGLRREDGAFLISDLRGTVARAAREGHLSPDTLERLRFEGDEFVGFVKGQMFHKGGALPNDVRSFLANKLHAELITDAAHHDIVKAFPELRNTVIPQAILADVRKVAARSSTGQFERIAKILTAANNVWVPLVLNNPGFHIYNAGYGQFQVWLAIGADAGNPKLMRSAYRSALVAMGGGNPDEMIQVGSRVLRAADIAEAAKNFGVFEGGRTADMVRAIGKNAAYKDQTAKRLWQHVSPWSDKGLHGAPRALLEGMGLDGIAKRLPRGENGLVNELVGRRAMGAVVGASPEAIVGKAAPTAENIQRMQVFLHELGEGKSVSDAAETVVKYLFDYTGAKMSDFEKSVVRKALPFYQWVKQSTRQTIEEMLKQPQKYAAVNKLFNMVDSSARASGSERNYDPREIPSYLQEQGAVQIPVGDRTANRLWMGNLQRPGEALSLVQPLLSGDVRGFAGKLGQQLGPAARAPYELATGEYLQGGAPISPSYAPDEPGQNAFTRATHVRPEDLPGYAARSVGGLPDLAASLAGVHSNPRRAGSDESLRWMTRTLRTVGGPRVTPVNPQTQKGANLERAEELRKKLDAYQLELGRRTVATSPLEEVLP